MNLGLQLRNVEAFSLVTQAMVRLVECEPNGFRMCSRASRNEQRSNRADPKRIRRVESCSSEVAVIKTAPSREENTNNNTGHVEILERAGLE